jgi:hypothetical protein
MGLLDDLAMGFGLKERDDDYYERTANTIRRTQGEDRYESYLNSNAYQNKPAYGGPFSFFGGNADDQGNSTFLGYGYYDDNDEWVKPGIDMKDGGGPGTSGLYFKGGPFSNLLNALNVRPYGAPEGADVGYAGEIGSPEYMRDIMDQGGPQAQGGGYQGAGPLSVAANVFLNPNVPSKRVPYDTVLTSTAMEPYNDLDMTQGTMFKPGTDYLTDWDLSSMAKRANRDLDTGGIY